MSEILKNAPEQSTPFAALEKEEFDPDKARALAEAAKSKQPENTEKKPKTMREIYEEHQEHFQNFKRTAEELVSSDFSDLSTEDSRSRTRIFYDIMNAEYTKRFLEKKYEHSDEHIVEKLNELETNYNKKGPIRKFFGKSDYESQKSHLELLRRSTSQTADTRHEEQQIAEKLPEYYGENIKDENGKLDTAKLQALSDRFFGKNDPARAEKIEFALTEFNSADASTMGDWAKSLKEPTADN